MFKEYESKPIQRNAVRIKKEGTLKCVKNNDYSYTEGSETVYFKAHQIPMHGDWVVRLTKEDTYHCTDSVFRERNIVSEGE
jgi:hypothetical protein